MLIAWLANHRWNIWRCRASRFAQGTDYSAGKTPAQLFSGDCSACHKTPRGLAKDRDARTLASFLREHYTSKVESAGALAVYLVGNPGPPRGYPQAPGQRQPTDGADTNIVVPEGEPAGHA